LGLQSNNPDDRHGYWGYSQTTLMTDTAIGATVYHYNTVQHFPVQSVCLVTTTYKNNK